MTDYAAQLKKSLEDGYSLAQEKLGASHEQCKEQYDKRVHGIPFEPNDLVWLHSTVIPQGHSRKLHLPWTGPFKVIERVSESDYRLKGRRTTHIVHFDRLKLCAPGTQFLTAVNGDSDVVNPQPTNLNSSDVFGEDMTIVTTENEQQPDPDPDLTPCQYPLRDRRPPIHLDLLLPTEWRGAMYRVYVKLL